MSVFCLILPFYWYLSAEDKETFDANWPAIVKWYTETSNEFVAEQPGRPSPVVHRLPESVGNIKGVLGHQPPAPELLQLSQRG